MPYADSPRPEKAAPRNKRERERIAFVELPPGPEAARNKRERERIAFVELPPGPEAARNKVSARNAAECSIVCGLKRATTADWEFAACGRTTRPYTLPIPRDRGAEFPASPHHEGTQPPIGSRGCTMVLCRALGLTAYGPYAWTQKERRRRPRQKKGTQPPIGFRGCTMVLSEP